MASLIVTSILQFQCGFQALGSEQISYGNLVYVENSKPRVAFFASPESHQGPHPYCETLKSALENGHELLITVDPENNKLLSLEAVPAAP